jgi:hypothetical protein
VQEQEQEQEQERELAPVQEQELASERELASVPEQVSERELQVPEQGLLGPTPYQTSFRIWAGRRPSAERVRRREEGSFSWIAFGAKTPARIWKRGSVSWLCW